MRRWLFADQLGPWFHEDAGSVLLVESHAVLRRRRFHRAKAHLILSALRHAHVDLGQRSRLVQAETYAEAIDDVGEPLEVCSPTSRAARAFVDQRADVTLLGERGWASSEAMFESWVTSRGRRRLLLEDFYRLVRSEHGILMDGEEPIGGRWNLDAENRERPPLGRARLDVAEPWWPDEDEIDEAVRSDLDRMQTDDERFLGDDGPRRFAATRQEALQALDHFVTHRLGAFGPTEDAMLSEDPWMSHSLLSAPLNLGLLHPLECAQAADDAYRAGAVPLNSAEGFVRQVLGWREYVWRLYWHEPDDYRDRDVLGANVDLPVWFAELQDDAVKANCLSTVLGQVRQHGWVHHIPRLMVLGNWALQHGISPTQLTDWFHRGFVDGYDWVMVPNVVGMSQHADGGVMATKPYASGGAYIDRMSDFCGPCVYDPKVRVGENACPFTAGYWAFLERHRERFAGNARMSQAVRGLDRLSDLDALLMQERQRGDAPP